MEMIRFGANYIPSKNWLHSWLDWDGKSIEEDLWAIKEIGIDHIRAHVIWPYFQLDQYVINKKAFQNLVSFREICEKVNMDFCLTVFTGWMSGLFFLPSWLQSVGKTGFCEGIFSNEEIIKGEKYFLKELSKVVGDSPNFLGFDLGNELSCLAGQDKTLTIKQADDWNCQMLQYCEELVPGKMHNNGDDHQPWLTNRYFSKEVLANTGAVTPLHCYAYFTGALERFGRKSEESIHLAPFMQELAQAYTNDPNNRKYWVQEFGTVSVVLNDEVFDFIRKSIEAMYSQNNLWGITWWCTHNISKNHTCFHPIEYELGLFDNNNKITDSGKLFYDMVKKYRENPVKPKERKQAFVLKKDESAADPLAVAWENGKRYADCIREGIYPAIILPEKVNDAEYLKLRGITNIINI